MKIKEPEIEKTKKREILKMKKCGGKDNEQKIMKIRKPKI